MGASSTLEQEEQQEEQEEQEEQEQPRVAKSQKRKAKRNQKKARVKRQRFARREAQWLDGMMKKVRDVIWALSRIFHGVPFQFYIAREMFYLEYEQVHKQPAFVAHHQAQCGPKAREWKQRWSRCFSTWGIPCDDNVCEVRMLLLLLLMRSD